MFAGDLTLTEPTHSPVALRDLDDLLEPFHASEKPRSRWRVGTEMEKFGILREDGRPLPYAGSRSVQAVFERLIEGHGWFPEREHTGGDVISLRRGETSVTLEPGGQLELSGAPHETVHASHGEFQGHMAELWDISDELSIAWLGLGFHPFASPEELPWVPKLRYSVMREYLPTRGAMALDMMRRTATVQANLDYRSESDAMRKLRVGLRISPIVTAMFANSPFVEGRITGDRSRRARVWLHTDPDRTGLLPFAWDAEATYRSYVEWALDVPMFLFKRGGAVIRNTGQSFRAFMRDGFEGHEATLADWDGHLNTLFPEVRLKRTLEVRGADSQDTSLVCALPALYKGLLYCEDALEKTEALTADLTFEEVDGSREQVAARALGAELGGRSVKEWAADILSIAAGGLRQISNLDADGQDESVHLRRLEELVRDGNSPADVLIAQVDGEADFKAAVLTHARL